MANPVLNDTIFKREASMAQSGVMTVKGTMTKALLLLILVVEAGGYTWKMFYEAINTATITGWMWGGLIGGLVTRAKRCVHRRACSCRRPCTRRNFGNVQ